MRAFLLLIGLICMAGCISTDPNTVYLLNKRISDMEAGKQRGDAQVVKSDGLNYVIIYVPLKNGGLYPVKIVQVSNNVFKGPRGEVYYYNVPTSSQLKTLYSF